MDSSNNSDDILLQELNSQTFFNLTTTINMYNHNLILNNNNISPAFFDPFSSTIAPPRAPWPKNPNNNNITPTPRTSKKRSRDSRRAPTTILSTDTSNFRAMVQEFTGIPSPPFSSSSPAPRFDFFKPYPPCYKSYYQQLAAGLNASSAANSLYNFGCQMPSSSYIVHTKENPNDLNFRPLFDPNGAMMVPGYGVMGSGLGRDPVGDPTQLSYGMGMKIGEGNGSFMVDSWFCSSD